MQWIVMINHNLEIIIEKMYGPDAMTGCWTLVLLCSFGANHCCIIKYFGVMINHHWKKTITDRKRI